MSPATGALPAAGWHGKLPALGDFATRRLDGAFVQVWDAWLAAGLAALALRPGWLDDYLASPVWRFVLLPGALPAAHGAAPSAAWAGVLMPSVDRVGRYYPLTLAHPLDGLPATAGAVDALLRWLAALDDAAADALHGDWSIDTLDAELARIGVPPAAQAAPSPNATEASDGRGRVKPLPLGVPGNDLVALLGAQAAALWHGTMRGRALWHAAAGPDAPRLLVSDGLAPELPAALFGPSAATAPAPAAAATPVPWPA